MHLKTKYDYHPDDPNCLSHNGKTYSIVLGYVTSKNDLLIELGIKGCLKGKALEDYKQLKEKGEKDEFMR